MDIYESGSFKKDLKRLKKKYPGIEKDYDIFKIAFRADFRVCGDAIPGFGGAAWKFRMRSRDMRRGKSGGFRIIGIVLSETEITLTIMYAKPDRENVSGEEILRSIESLHRENRTIN